MKVYLVMLADYEGYYVFGVYEQEAVAKAALPIAEEKIGLVGEVWETEILTEPDPKPESLETKNWKRINSIEEAMK